MYRSKFAALGFVAVLVASIGSLTPVQASPLKPSVATSTCQQPLDWSKRDPRSLTNAEVELYGLPPRPAVTSAHYAEWLNVAKHTRHRFCGTIPTKNPGTNGTNYIPDHLWMRWAGYPSASYQNTSGGLNDAYAHWNVPCLRTNAILRTSSAWVGLGGGGSGSQLLQVGTDSSDDWAGQPFYQAWTENTGAYSQETEQVRFPVNCGDAMYGEVWVATHAAIYDLTNGSFFNNLDGANSPTTSNWECIDEWYGRDLIPQQYYADYNNVFFTDCHGNNLNVTNSAIRFQDTPTPADIECYADEPADTHQMAGVGTLDSNGGFKVNWYRSN